MISLDAGSVTLTDRRTQRAWEVDVQAFELAAAPVTAAQYRPGAESQRPVASVSWWEAVQFCNRASADAGFELAYTSGPRYGALDAIGWYRDNSQERSHDVGGKQSNSWGFYDLLGNVWEWCWDRYDPEVYGEYRVLRGGGWFDEHWSCRASVRRRSHPALTLDDVGFRIARSLPS